MRAGASPRQDIRRQRPNMAGNPIEIDPANSPPEKIQICANDFIASCI
jgi:hypothetical protein